MSASLAMPSLVSDPCNLWRSRDATWVCQGHSPEKAIEESSAPPSTGLLKRPAPARDSRAGMAFLLQQMVCSVVQDELISPQGKKMS